MYPTMVWGPKNTNQVFRSPHHSSSEEDDSCSSRMMIRRSFAFDEWDDDNNEREELDIAIMSNKDASLVQEHHEDDFLREEDLQSVIRQCFAFDEWDDDKNERTEMPEKKRDQEDTSGRIVNLFQSSLALESAPTPNTKFGSTIITPSPTSKQCENEGRMSIKEPIPLYSSHESNIPMDQGTRKSSFPNFENSQPTNYTQLEDLFRKEFKESNVNNFPPYYCQGIPRRASAFRTVTGNNQNVGSNDHNRYPATNPSSSLERIEGTTNDSPLLEEHYIFESPTTSLSEDSSNVPSFIVCYNKNKDTLNE